MKRFAVIVAMATLAVFGEDVLSPSAKAFVNRRYVHHQTVERMPDGKTVVTRYFYRGSKPDKEKPVESFVVKPAVGKVQNNPLQNELEQLRIQLSKRAEELAAKIEELERSEEVRERLQKARERIMSDLTEKRDTAKLATTKAIYQAIIDLFEKAEENDE